VINVTIKQAIQKLVEAQFGINNNNNHTNVSLKHQFIELFERATMMSQFLKKPKNPNFCIGSL
jgi:hypothetical protein